MNNHRLTRSNAKGGQQGALIPSHSHEETDIETTGNTCPLVPPSINDLHREVQEWRNRALLAESRLAVLETQNTTTKDRK